MFSDNTSQVWKLPDGILNNSNYAVVEWEFEHEGEFMHLAQLKDLLDKHHLSVDLYLKYLPYARQDKDVDNYQTFALISFSRLLNFLSFNKIIIVDPHSEKALDLIENSEAIYPHDRVAQAIKKTDTNKIKKSQKGRVAVLQNDENSYKHIDTLYQTDTIKENLLRKVFCNGRLLVDEKFSDIKARIVSHSSTERVGG